MLSSLRIRNFRIFDAIDIERLARVNLVVGKNNSGKTCLLEALRLYGDGASLSGFLSRNIQGEGTPSTRLVGTNTFDDMQTLEHWRRVAVRPSDRAIIEDALRIIDPEFRELSAFSSSQPRMAGTASSRFVT